MKRMISSLLILVLCLTLTGITVPAAAESGIEAGSVLTFGSYEQDNDAANGAEPIEWTVLEVEGNKALLISNVGLDARPYHTDYVDVTWEACSLRAWLNNDFLTAAFTDEEQAAILTVEVDNSDSQGYDFTTEYDYAEAVTGGSNTLDKVYLLSYAEANRYYEVTYENDRNSAARMAPTPFAKQNGASADTKKKAPNGARAGWWWLRSPGSVQSYAARVGSDGSLGLDLVNKSASCIRPVLWVDLTSNLF